MLYTLDCKVVPFLVRVKWGLFYDFKIFELIFASPVLPKFPNFYTIIDFIVKGAFFAYSRNSSKFDFFYKHYFMFREERSALGSFENSEESFCFSQVGQIMHSKLLAEPSGKISPHQKKSSWHNFEILESDQARKMHYRISP